MFKGITNSHTFLNNVNSKIGILGCTGRYLLIMHWSTKKTNKSHKNYNVIDYKYLSGNIMQMILTEEIHVCSLDLYHGFRSL